MASDSQSRRPRRIVRFTAGAAILAMAALAFVAFRGCSRWLAHAVVDAPNANRSAVELSSSTPKPAPSRHECRTMRIEVGPPAASLSIAIMDAASIDDAATPSRGRGTVLILHGLRDRKESQLGLAETLADAGYRVVLIDLRGQGQSTGQWLTYGVVESRDISQVLDHLERAGEVSQPIGIIGCSYGAAVGLQLAAVDSRVKAVVAIACFTSLCDIVPQYVRHYGLGWIVPKSDIEGGLKLAGELASFDPHQASPLRAIQSTATPVLLIHGANDEHIPASHSRALHEAASEHSELLIVDGADHVSIFTTGSGGVTQRCIEWLNEHLE